MPQTQGLPGEQAGQFNISTIHETAMNIVHVIATIFTMPVEIFLRPGYGTTYFPPPMVFISGLMLIFATAFFGLVAMATSMIPFVRIAGPSGMFGLGTFTSVYFIASVCHGFRLWRRMIHMELEQVSSYEGEALPFFRLLPKGGSFFFVRIVWEPVFLFVLSTVMGNMGFFQNPLVIYAQTSAILLAMKNYISWFRTWHFLRITMDQAYIGPIIGKIVSNTATDDELARVHLASLPTDLPQDLRRSTITHIARAFGAEEVGQ